MLWIGIALLVGIVVIVGVGYYGSHLITDIPFLAVPYTPKDFGWTYEEVAFTAADGVRLGGWFVPAQKPSSVTIIVQHGIGSNHGDMLLNTACLQREGTWNLFYYNFRGHGGSEGNQTSLGPLELRDLEGALRFLREHKPQASRHIGIYGHSLGAAVALVGAARLPEIEAVAAESSFSTISKTVAHFATQIHGIPYFPFVPLAIFIASLRLGVRLGHFDPVAAIGRIAPRPVYLIQGERDFRIPAKDAQALWEAAREPKEFWLVPGADHGDPWMVAKDEFEHRLVGFFKRAFG